MLQIQYAERRKKHIYYVLSVCVCVWGGGYALAECALFMGTYVCVIVNVVFPCNDSEEEEELFLVFPLTEHRGS